MDEDKQLLEFFFNGGDPATLEDAQIQRLFQLTSPDAPQGSIAGMMKQSTVQGDPVQATPAPAPALSGLARTVPPSKATELPPNTFQKFMSTLLQGGTLASGMMIPSAPVRTLATMMLGGGAAAAEGKNPFEEAAFQGAMETGMPLVGKLANKAANQAARINFPWGVSQGGKWKKYVDALERRRADEGFSLSPPIGKERSLAGTALRRPKQKDVLGERMDLIKQQIPEVDIPLTSVADRVRAKQPAAADILGASEPISGLRQPMNASNRTFFSENDALLRNEIRPQPGVIRPADRTLPGYVSDEPLSNISFGEAIEMSQRQGKEAKPIFEMIGKGQGKWVTPDDNPSMAAAKLRKEALMDTAENRARQGGEGGNLLADLLLKTNRQYSDLFRTQDMNKLMRRGGMHASMRAGIGGMLGGATGYPTDNTTEGGGLGMLTGLLAGSPNISRLGRLLQAGAQATPTLQRGNKMYSDLFAPDVKMRKP